MRRLDVEKKFLKKDYFVFLSQIKNLSPFCFLHKKRDQIQVLVPFLVPFDCKSLIFSGCCGEGGIRTPGTLTSSAV